MINLLHQWWNMELLLEDTAISLKERALHIVIYFIALERYTTQSLGRWKITRFITIDVVEEVLSTSSRLLQLSSLLCLLWQEI
jgi:hypothetical protein